jgi:two-component system C4-dicarboxylate transport sensor histidine kinase DctB
MRTASLSSPAPRLALSHDAAARSGARRWYGRPSRRSRPLQPLGVTPTGEGPLVRIDTLGEGQWIHAAPAGVSGWHVHRFVPVGEHIANAQHGMGSGRAGGRGRPGRAGGPVAAAPSPTAAHGRAQGRSRCPHRRTAPRNRRTHRSRTARRSLARGIAAGQSPRHAGAGSAGIAHETAQPVAAIRSYADNGIAFLERGDIATARPISPRSAD